MRGIYELETLRDSSGAAVVVTGATITVRKESDGALATIYNTVSGGSALSNPYTIAGSTIQFYAEQDDRYRIDIASGTLTRTIRFQSVSIDTLTVKSESATTSAGQVTAHDADDAAHGMSASGIAVLRGTPAGGRTALELGNSATLNVGVDPGTVCAGNDPRLAESGGSGVAFATVTPATDADVTLTSAQYGANAIRLATGAWTVARNVIMPDNAREWQFFNDGIYAATVKTAAGTGATVQPGVTTRLICDATNVIQELTAAGTSYSGALTATDAQAAIDETMSNVTLGVNNIVNGQFKVAQIGETFVSPGTGNYDLDGWIRSGSGGAVTISRVAGSVTGSYARQSEVTTAVPTLAAGDFEFVQTRLLGYDCVKYIGNTFTIRAKVKSDVTGIHCIAIYNGTQTYVHEVNILAANTWQTEIITVVGGISSINSSTNQYGFILRFTQAAGTSWQTATTDEWVTGNFFGTAAQVNGLATVGNKFSIEDVSINLGTVALPNVTGFDAELARCETMCWKMNQQYGTYVSGGYRVTLHFPKTMIAVPTAELSGAAASALGVGALVLTGVQNITNKGFRDFTTSSTAPAVGSEVSISYVKFSARL